MGLDSVEIVVEVENCFGIEIQDEDAANMRTVQHMVDYVWDRIEHKDAKACFVSSSVRTLTSNLPYSHLPATLLKLVTRSNLMPCGISLKKN